jgi:hypothetical protein
MSGTVLFDDTTEAGTGSILNPLPQADSFSTGPVFAVSDVQVDLYDQSVDGGTVDVLLLADNASTPGAVLATLDVIADTSLPTNPGTITDISNVHATLTLASVTLTANTRYWIEVVSDPSGSVSQAGWEVAADALGSGYDSGGTGDLTSEFNAFTAGGYFTSQNANAVTQPFIMSVTAACFAAGTRILTSEGEIAVEALRAGDLVAAMHSGGLAPVRWIGHRAVDCTRHPKPHDVWPVHVAPGAFGPGRPRRELMLSPDHSVFVTCEETGPRGALIPIRYLINDATIVQCPVDAVSYFHVELAQHDVILAEGLPAETYLDTGNRVAFANGGGSTMAHPDFSLKVWDKEGCAPLVLAGPVLTALRARATRDAEALGYAQTSDADLHLIVDGARIDGEREGAVFRFAVPEGARAIRLASRSAVPAHVTGPDADPRRLGVAVARIQADGQERPFGPGVGWHPAEQGWQWTDGAAALPCAGARQIEIQLALVSRYWCSRASPAMAAAA